MKMRHAGALATVLALGAGSLAVAPPSAHATTLAELSVEQLTDASTWIARGTITEVWTEVDDRDRVWTRARLDVSRVLKGPSSPDELILDSLGGVHTDGRVTIVHAAARYSPEEEVIVFLDEIRHGTRLAPVGMFLGKYTIRRAPGDDRQHVQRWHGKTLEHYDGRFLPHPAAERRVYLDDLMSRVESRLDTGWDGQPIPGLSATELEKINAPERRIR